MGGLVITCLLLVACAGAGGDGARTEDAGPGTSGPATTDAASADAYVEAVAESMVEDQQTGFTLDQEAATCMGTAIVDAVGVDTLTAAEITPEEVAEAEGFADLDADLPDDAVAGLAEGFADCGLAELVLENLVEELELSPEAATCFDAAVDDQAVSEAVAVTYIDGSGDGLAALIGDGFAECPEVMTAYVLAGASVPASPEDEACVRSVIEANPDAARSAVIDDPDATDQLDTLIADSCPGFDVING